MGDCKPKTHTQIVRATGLYEPAVWIVLNHYGKKGFILHKDKSILKYERFFKGKASFRGNPSKTFQADMRLSRIAVYNALDKKPDDVTKPRRPRKRRRS